MTEAPHAYANWLPLLDRFRDGDDSALELMWEGSIEWSSVVAERWTLHVTAALEARLQAVSKRLQLGLNRSGGDAHAIALALLDAKRALKPLRSFASLPCMPEQVGEHLKGELERWTRRTQETLEQGAADVRADNGRLLKIIRDNSLTTAAAAEAPPATANENAGEPMRRTRRVIL